MPGSKVGPYAVVNAVVKWDPRNLWLFDARSASSASVMPMGHRKYLMYY